MLPFADDLFESTPLSDAYFDHGHERGAGPSLLPDRARIDVSLPLELDAWLSEKAFERGLARAQLIRLILRRVRGASPAL